MAAMRLRPSRSRLSFIIVSGRFDLEVQRAWCSAQPADTTGLKVPRRQAYAVRCRRDWSKGEDHCRVPSIHIGARMPLPILLRFCCFAA